MDSLQLFEIIQNSGARRRTGRGFRKIDRRENLRAAGVLMNIEPSDYTPTKILKTACFFNDRGIYLNQQ